MRIYLCGITTNQYSNIKRLTSVHRYFDGLIFCVDDKAAEDGTLELLEERKGHGKIVYRHWSNDNDWQMNEFLRQGPMKMGDWFVFRDSEESLSEDFCANLPQLIKQLEGDNIQTTFWEGKIFMAKYYDDLFFFGNPHFGLQNARDKKIELKGSGLVDDTKVTYNNRNRTVAEWWKTHLKYYWVYGRSNHLLLGNENRVEEFERREKNRVALRLKLHKKGVDLTMDGIHSYLSDKAWLNDLDVKFMILGEPILMRYYKRYILNTEEQEVIEELGVN